MRGEKAVGVIIALTRIRPAELFPAQRIVAAKGQLVEGLRYVRSQPLLMHLLIMLGLVGMLSYEFSVILPLMAELTFNAGSSGYAAQTGAMGAGSVVGGAAAITAAAIGFVAARHRNEIPVQELSTAA